MKKALLLLIPSFLFALQLPVHKEVLDNGLTVLLHPNKQSPTVSCRLFYVTGSVHEVPEIGRASCRERV